jgi:phage-related minor tail protein
MAKAIETAFYAREREGKSLDQCFAEVAAEFGVSVDDVVDALNEAALS